jgi:hypothetical protein
MGRRVRRGGIGGARGNGELCRRRKGGKERITSCGLGLLSVGPRPKCCNMRNTKDLDKGNRSGSRVKNRDIKGWGQGMDRRGANISLSLVCRMGEKEVVGLKKTMGKVVDRRRGKRGTVDNEG